MAGRTLMEAAAATPKYVGPVATRGFFCDATSPNAQQMNESYHFARDEIVAIQVGWANCYGSGGLEVGSGGPISIKASAIDASGNFAQLTFGSGSGGALGISAVGAVQGVNPNLGLIFSDMRPFNAVPGDLFRIRSYQTNNGNMLYNGSQGWLGFDKMAYGASGVPDLTMGGTITSTAPGATFVSPPICILGYTRKGTVYILLDSIAFEGSPSDVVNDAFLDCGLARPFGPEMAYINGAIGSSTCQGMAAGGAGYTVRTALGNLCSHGFNNGGTNDLGGRTVTQLVADHSAIAAKWPAMKMFAGTMLPRTNSTDGWTSLVNQSVITAGSFETKRIDFNDNYVRGGKIPGIVGYYDLADAFESDRNSGRISVGYLPGAATGIANTLDGLHPNPPGYQRFRRSGVVRPNYMHR